MSETSEALEHESKKLSARQLIITACQDIKNDAHYLVAIFSNVNCKVLGLVL